MAGEKRYGEVAAPIFMKKRNGYSIVVLIVLLAALNSSIFELRAETHSYRYELTTRSGEPRYETELTNLTNFAGARYDVEVDSHGRIARVKYVQGGKTNSEVVYLFSGNQKLPNAYKKFEAGELTSIVKIKRNSDGSRARVDHLTARETLTSYEVYHYHSENVERHIYSSKDVQTINSLSYFSDRNLLIKTVSSQPGNNGTSVATDFDEMTGQKKYARQTRNGELQNKQEYFYDRDGNLTHKDVYSGKSGLMFASDEYSDGLPVKRIYKRENGSVGRELRYFYDEKRWLIKTEVYFEGKFICNLVYDRLQDGFVQRTKAIGPNGDLWAEYPNPVIEITSRGEAINQTNSIIYMKGNWW